MSKQYFLDPDYRKQAPKKGAHCIRCQKAIKGEAVKVSYATEWTVTEGGEHLIGRDCWKKITG